jgi:hypothetical protein
VWNNWAQNPSFVVAAQDLDAYLAERMSVGPSATVGVPLDVRLDPAVYQSQVQFESPGPGGSSVVAPVTATVAGERFEASLPATDRSGFYTVRLTRGDGSPETQTFAVNVNPAEGNLAALDAEQLAVRLRGIRYRYEQASAFQTSAAGFDGHDLTETILCLLVILLVIEQLLALSASYHPTAVHRLPQGGSA